MSRQIKSVNTTNKKIIAMKTNNKCVYCGRDVQDYNKSIEHIVPQSIYKWTENILTDSEKEELKGLLTSNTNLYLAHEKCNRHKLDTIPNKSDMDALNISMNQKKNLKILISKVQIYKDKYLSLKNAVSARNNNRCKMCGCKINYKYETVRRIDNHKERNISNAMIVCSTCNDKVYANRKKRERRNKNNMRKVLTN